MGNSVHGAALNIGDLACVSGVAGAGGTAAAAADACAALVAGGVYHRIVALDHKAEAGALVAAANAGTAAVAGGVHLAAIFDGHINAPASFAAANAGTALAAGGGNVRPAGDDQSVQVAALASADAGSPLAAGGIDLAAGDAPVGVDHAAALAAADARSTGTAVGRNVTAGDVDVPGMGRSAPGGTADACTAGSAGGSQVAGVALFVRLVRAVVILFILDDELVEDVSLLDACMALAADQSVVTVQLQHDRAAVHSAEGKGSLALFRCVNGDIPQGHIGRDGRALGIHRHGVAGGLDLLGVFVLGGDDHIIVRTVFDLTVFIGDIPAGAVRLCDGLLVLGVDIDAQVASGQVVDIRKGRSRNGCEDGHDRRSREDP